MSTTIKLPSMQPKLRFLVKALSVILLSFITANSFAQYNHYKENVGTATVTTDKPDYAPRSNAVFTGVGFAPGETVTLKVRNLTQACNAYDKTDSSYQPWTVVADGSGNFVTNWTVCDCAGDSLRLRAVGAVSHDTAYAYFSDSDPLTITGAYCSGSQTSNFSISVPSNANNVRCIRLEFTGLPAGVTVASVATGNLPVGWGATISSTSANISTTVADLPKSATYNFSVTFSGALGVSFTANYKSGSSCPSNVSGGNSVAITASASPNAPTAVNYSAAYDGQSHTGSATVGSGEVVDWYTSATGNTSTVAPSGTNVGTYTAYAEARKTTTGCVSSSRTQVTVTIGKANAVITVNPYSVTYDGNAHTSTFTAVGVESTPADLSALMTVSGTTHTAAGTYNGDTWSFAGNSNYNATSGTVDNAIGKATAVITVNPYTVTYDGDAHTSTATATGAKGEDLASLLQLGGTTHTLAGTYNGDTWNFTGDNNYESATGTVNNKINKATAVITVNPYTVTYDGDAHTSTATATGAKGEDLASLLQLGGTTHTLAGTYNGDTWNFTGDNNYESATGTVNNKINKATAVITVNPYTVTYDGDAHTSTATATGAKGEDLASLLQLGGTTHTLAGTYNGDTWNFTGDNNYESATGTVNNKINKATAVITVNPYTVTYDGDAHTSTATATGAKGEDLASLLQLGGTTHTLAGTYNGDTWNFTGDNNYESATGTVNNKINKATAVITVNPYTVTYDGDAHTSTATATGAKGEDLASLLQLGGTTHTLAGTYNGDTWNFTGDNNYESATGTVNNKINKATAVITVNPYTVTYDGDAHTSTATATGAKGEDLASLLQLGGTTHTLAGTYNGDTWNFTGDNNYESATGTVNNKINKATAVITVNPYSVTYDGNAHTSTFTAVGVESTPADLSALMTVSGTTHTAAGTYNGDTWNFTGDNNYESATGTVNNKINKATAVITVNPYTVTYDGDAHTSTATATGAKGEDLASLLQLGGTTHTLAGTYNGDTWNFTGDNNYESATGTVNNKINKATAVITVNPYTVTYDGDAHTSTATATGAKGEDLASLLQLGGTTHTLAGTYNGDTWNFTGDNNYESATGTVNNKINKATAVITVNPYTVTYDGDAHTSTATATGAKGEDLASLLQLGGTTHTLAGTYNGDTWNFTGDNNYESTTGTVNNKINKATAVITVNPYSVTYDGNAHTSTFTAVGVESTPADLSALMTVSGTTHTAAGTYNGDTWNFTGDNNYESATGTVNNKINKATAVITVNPYTVTYDGDAHTSTATATGAKGEDLASLLQLGGTTHTLAGTYNGDTWNFTGDNNYESATGTVNNKINKATAVITVNPYTVTYDGDAHTSTATATGAKGEDLASLLQLGGTTHTLAGTYNGDTWNFTGDNNYESATGTVNNKINKATAVITVNPYTVTYDGDAHTSTATATGAKGEDLASLLQLGGTTHTLAGTYNGDTWNFTGDNNYESTTGTVNNKINKATAVITVNPYSVTYDGNAHTSTFTAVGVESTPADLSALMTVSGTTHTAAGTYNGDTWNFTGDNNYESATGTVNNKINKATAVITVNPYTVTYDGDAHTSTATATGAKGEDLASLLQLGGTTHTLAGTYNGDTWNFTGDNNYESATGTVNNKINKATAVITVNPYTVTYDGDAHTSTATATGAKGEDLASLLQLGGTTHTLAGTYNGDTWNFTGDNNYESATGTVNNKINKATAVITVNPYTVTYDGDAHTSTATATGAKGEDLASLLQLGGTTHTLAGTYNGDTWNFTGDNNYESATGTVNNKINKATAVITVNPYTVTYDGDAHTSTATATGAKGEDLASLLQLGGTTHTLAGTYNGDTWNFTGDNNYESATGTVNNKINKATAVITVNPYTVTYDGDAHTSTATATGAKGEDLASLLQLGGTTHTLAGTYNGDTWNFTGDNNYESATGTVNNKINKATAVITVNPYTVTYDGDAHTSTATATGAKGEDLASLLQLGGTTHTLAGTYNGDTWNFTGDNNYESATGTVNNKINKATAVITVNPYTVTYDGDAHTSTATATGAKGEDLASLLQLGGTTHTLAGTYNGDTWNFTGDNNYESATGTVNNKINKATAVITVNPYTVTYDGDAHTSTATATGAKGEDLASLLQLGGTTHTLAGTYNGDTWNFTGDNNYESATGTVNNKINKATAVITVNPYTVTYDGDAHTSTATATGAKGEDLASLLQLGGTTHTLAGTYNGDTWNFTGDNNYESTTGTVNNKINKATAVITVNPYSVTYDGNAHTSTFTAVGVESTPADLSALMTVSGTTHTAAGTYNGDTWNFTGDNNYESATGTVNNKINKATAVITVNPYTVTYDGDAHTSTATATGAKGEDLASLLQLGGTTHTLAGTYNGDTWNFTGDNNYESTTGTVNNKINKAPSTTTVTVSNATFDTNPHGGTASVTGAGGLNQSLSVTYTGINGTVYAASTTKPTNAGQYSASASFAGDDNHNPSSDTKSFTIAKADATITAVTINSSPVQYSDPVTFVATITSTTAQSQLNSTGGTVEFKLKSLSGTISLGSSVLADWSNGTVTKQFIITQAPGSYTVVAVFTPTNAANFSGSTNTNCGALSINTEDARVDYTGEVIKATPTATSTSATIRLSANIYDITALNLDPQYDAFAGDITKARVMFVNRDRNNAPLSGWLSPTPVSSADSKVGTVSFDWNVNLGSASSVDSVIGIIIGGPDSYYQRDTYDDNLVITVYQPNGDFITGGGIVTNTQSEGSLKADAGSKTNFGFNVRFNKKGTNLQGNLNFIFRSAGHTYQVKSNAMQGLGVNASNPASQTANFISKCNMTDITNPNSPISMGGNKYMYVNMVDNGDVGTKDMISFVLVDGTANPNVLSNIIYSSNWSNSKTEMKNLSGGNLIVHSGFNLGGNEQIVPNKSDLQVAPLTLPAKFDATAYPNPTTSQFNLKLESSNRQDEISIIVYSVNGKVVEQRQHLTAGQTIQLGALYRPGVYIIEMIQGNQRKQLKLVKIPD